MGQLGMDQTGGEQSGVRLVKGSREQTTIVQVVGPLALKTVAVFQDTVREAEIKDTIVDLSAVPFIDSAGLGAILTHFVHTTKNGNKFAITGVGGRVRGMFKTTRADSVLPVFADIEAAEASFRDAEGFPSPSA